MTTTGHLAAGGGRGAYAANVQGFAWPMVLAFGTAVALIVAVGLRQFGWLAP